MKENILYLMTLGLFVGCVTQTTHTNNTDRVPAARSEFSLNRPVPDMPAEDCCTFPLDYPSLLEIDNETTRGHFGADRAKERIKASANVIGYKGAAVRAIAKGQVVSVDRWHGNVGKDYIVAVRSEGITIRYGGILVSSKIRKMASDFQKGKMGLSDVQPGDMIGSLTSIDHEGFIRTYNQIQEAAAARQPLLEGRLTVPLYIEVYVHKPDVGIRKGFGGPGPYRRRTDLINPTQFLMDLEKASF